MIKQLQPTDFNSNDILALLDLEDPSITISNIVINDSQKIISLETPPTPHYCPCCGYRMHSKGIKKRTIKHPILQDTYRLTLILNQRRWKCTNSDCRYDISETFHFVDKHCRTTNATDMMILLAYRDLTATTTSIAAKFNVSDTYVHDVFNRYVKLKRLPLTEVISIDEVHLDMDSRCPYALVIQDFFSGDIIDILPSRRNNTTEPYFASIPIDERETVKYLISDMYNPYITYVNKYFPNAVSVVDSFHVIQWIIREIDKYMRQLSKKFKQRDTKLVEEISAKRGRQVKLPASDEVYLLDHYRWLVLKNQNSIEYNTHLRMDRHYHRYMNTFDYEYELFRLDPTLREYRDLKELYVQFNSRNAGAPLNASIELDELINTYLHCGHEIFVSYAGLLYRYKESIINSFIMVEKLGKNGTYKSRLSNGPIESMNRKIKDLKRQGRGYRNFEHFRNRVLYATRSNPVLDGTKKS